MPDHYAIAPPRPGHSPQMLVFSYHKSGTTLFHVILRKIAERLNLRMAALFGMVDAIDPDLDMVLIGHALLRSHPARPFRAVRVVRDPRDIWVSSYLYHRRTTEAWCTNMDFNPTPPITYPRVDFSFQHRSEQWKRGWLRRLDGRSYQQNLLDRDPAAGLDFELAGYTDCTLEAMRGWRFSGPAVMDVRLEDIMREFDASMARIFRHLGFTAPNLAMILEIAATEDINRMNDAELSGNTHIHSRAISKWRELLSSAQIAAFEQRHGELIDCLGYQRGIGQH